MVYTCINYKTKKQLVQDVKDGVQVKVFQPGPFGSAVRDGTCALEGPHYPQPHKWYASAVIKDGCIVSVK